MHTSRASTAEKSTQRYVLLTELRSRLHARKCRVVRSEAMRLLCESCNSTAWFHADKAAATAAASPVHHVFQQKAVLAHHLTFAG